MFESHPSQDDLKRINDSLDRISDERRIMTLSNSPRKLEVYLVHNPNFFINLLDSQVLELCLFNEKCCEQMINFFKDLDGKQALLQKLESRLDNLSTLRFSRSPG